MDEAKDEVKEIVDFLRQPERFSTHRRTHPEGRAARRPAGHRQDAAGALDRRRSGRAVPVRERLGLRRDVRRRRRLARPPAVQGRAPPPSCIIFIDELDAVGRSRGGNSLSHEEREQTLNQLLVEMDGFEPQPGIVVIAATNRPDILDPALLRPGRFDRQVTVGNPDLKGRERSSASTRRKVAIGRRRGPAVDRARHARLLRRRPRQPGQRGGAVRRARRTRQRSPARDLEAARDKVLMGVERRSVVLSEHERVNCAYHEAGHAVVAALLPHADPLHKVTIIPRGRAHGRDDAAAGSAIGTPTRKGYLEAQIAVLMGGRVAEELFMSHMTSGASNDIERATDIAQHMVCELGMSALGLRAFRKPGNTFDRRQAARDQRGHRAARRRGDREDPRRRLRPRARAARSQQGRRQGARRSAPRAGSARSRRNQGAARAGQRQRVTRPGRRRLAARVSRGGPSYTPPPYARRSCASRGRLLWW